jgi:hypothetical protein
MAEMNKSSVNFGESGGNVFENISRKLGTRNAEMQKGFGAARLQHAQHEHEKWMLAGAHVINEEAKDNEHRRKSEFQKQLHAGAEPGTQVGFTHGDVSASYTKKAKAAKTTPTSEAAPQEPSTTIAPTPVHVGMPTMPSIKRNTTAPESPSISEPAKEEAPKPLVGRDPNTGQAMSLKPRGETAPKKAPRVSSVKNTASVGRNARGQAVSLKNK